MGANSSIEWTTHTFNPWQGCVKVSPACKHCYAATLGKRFGVEWGPSARRKFQSDTYWNEPRKWNRQAEKSGERPRVFCASMADVFEMLPDGHPDAEQMSQERARLWRLIEETPHLDWLLLTKRPENVLGMTPGHWDMTHWPAHVWVGTTVENQELADKRIPELLQIPAQVRFLSCEPLLGPLDLSRWMGAKRLEVALNCPVGVECEHGFDVCPRCDFRPLDWVIAGGESGPGARPSHPDWFSSLRDQCQAAGVPFHFKQWGAWAPTETLQERVRASQSEVYLLRDGTTVHRAMRHSATTVEMNYVGKKAAGRMLDGRTWDEMPAPAGRIESVATLAAGGAR